MNKLIDSIKKHEGYVGIVYKDSLGIDTIGYGFAIKDLELDEDGDGERPMTGTRNKRYSYGNVLPVRSWRIF